MEAITVDHQKCKPLIARQIHAVVFTDSLHPRNKCADLHSMHRDLEEIPTGFKAVWNRSVRWARIVTDMQ